MKVVVTNLLSVLMLCLLCSCAIVGSEDNSDFAHARVVLGVDLGPDPVSGVNEYWISVSKDTEAPKRSKIDGRLTISSSAQGAVCLWLELPQIEETAGLTGIRSLVSRCLVAEKEFIEDLMKGTRIQCVPEPPEGWLESEKYVRVVLTPVAGELKNNLNSLMTDFRGVEPVIRSNGITEASFTAEPILVSVTEEEFRFLGN